MDDRIREVYSLRKGGQIEDAYHLALSVFQEDADDDTKKALSWTLIDLCKKFISENKLSQAEIYFNQLYNIQFDFEDDFVETIQKQIRFLKPKIDTNYNLIQQAEGFSKYGQEEQALGVIRSMIENNQLSKLHHETYGWIIYRYIKSVEENATSIEIRTQLRDYINLKNERPSLLHSMILNFALNYSKHSDFNFYNFFVLWNPVNLRYEDLHNGYKDGKDIPSLISRICRVFANTNAGVDIEKEIIQKIDLDREVILDFFREPYFWNLYNAHKENRITELWELFSRYNIIYGKYGRSKWHSEILKIADRFMKENESWRFLSFFKEWNPSHFTDSDWREEKGKDGETFKPVAIKAIKKSFDIIKSQQNNTDTDLTWLIEVYDKAIKLFPDDEWLIREKALLHIWQKDLDTAIHIYKKLVLDLGDKYYIWQEFSECVISNNQLKIGMLSKALSLERNEDFLGDIHLELAKSLINENLLENALFELLTYKKHRENKDWKLSPDFESLYSKVQTVQLDIADNRDLYNRFIPVAENSTYHDIDWIEFVLVDKWKNEDNKEKIAFVNSDSSIEFAIGVNRFPVLRKIKTGQVCKFKLHKREIKKEVDNQYSWQPKNIITENKYIPLIVEQSKKEDWSILPTKYGYVEYVNQEKRILHIVGDESDELFYKYDKEFLKKGDFVFFRHYSKTIKNEKKLFPIGIEKCERELAIGKFKNRVVAVDDVNESKKLFHYVLGKRLLTGIVFFDDTDIRPVVGEFLKVYYYVKKNKDGKKKIVTLSVEKTEEQNTELVKTVSGLLKLKYKGGFDVDMYEDWKDENWGNKKNIADFAFIGDFYVSINILQQYNITEDCVVTAKAVYTGDGDKWKVYDIDKQ